MARGDSLARQLSLMKMLEDRQELAVSDVARELGYTTRTVYRDLAVLERIGVPIYQDRTGRRARWRVVDGYRRRLSVSLSWSEMLALALGRKLLAGLAGTPLADGSASALQKIGSALPTELARRASRADESVSATLGGAHEYRERVLRLVLDAIERSETLALSYRKPGAGVAVERVVDPYLLHVQSGVVYLIGFAHDRGAVRTFRADRVRDARLTGRAFTSRVPFSISNLAQGAFGPWEGRPRRIRLSFSPEVASRVAERASHPTQRGQWRSDGWLDVEMRLPLCPALFSWVLGFGSSVEVRGPMELARRITRVITRMGNDNVRYRGIRHLDHA